MDRAAIGDSEARVPNSALDYDADLVYRYLGSPFTGIGYEESQHGAVALSEIRYVDGQQHGIASDWFPTGVLAAESRLFENTCTDGSGSSTRPASWSRSVVRVRDRHTTGESSSRVT